MKFSVRAKKQQNEELCMINKTSPHIENISPTGDEFRIFVIQLLLHEIASAAKLLYYKSINAP